VSVLSVTVRLQPIIRLCQLPDIRLLEEPGYSSRNNRASDRIARRVPPLKAFRGTRVLPSTVSGPVECSHGRHRRSSCDCRLRRSGVHPFMALLLQ